MRHTGLLFQLQPPAQDSSSHVANELPPISLHGTGVDGDGPMVAETGNEPNDAARHQQATGPGQSSLPYPQLSQTISSANFAPAAHLAEHYSPPGGERLQCATHQQFKHQFAMHTSTAVVYFTDSYKLCVFCKRCELNALS